MQTHDDEIVMREIVLPEFSLKIYKMTSVCWASECVDKEDQPGRKMQKFMVSHFDVNR